MIEFEEQFRQYKLYIDNDIAAYSQHVRQTSLKEYGVSGALIADTFLDILGRGGKRLRGSLAICGYQMLGGTDMAMITRAATALEMVHAYALILDDIQDNAFLRRGKPSAHRMLAEYHRKHHLLGDAYHTGVSLALNAAMLGIHASQMLFAGLNTDDELKVKVIGIVNLAITVTAYGQTYDLLHEISPKVEADKIIKVLEWKTATYTFLNPLCVGMVLAGAGCQDTDAIRQYALPVGMAFQITDDIIGVFGDDSLSGKEAMGDIREGKRTILTEYAFAHASEEDVRFLKSCLGNSKLNRTNFARCQQIIKDSGALSFATEKAGQYIQAARQHLANQARGWQKEQITFLDQLAGQLQNRRY